MSLAAALVPGEEVATLESGAMRGHGTWIPEGSKTLVSCGAGRVERVNKLVSVAPVRGRYRGEVGDLVVGRIAEIAHKSWRVNVGSARRATLALSSVTLPDDAQRIRTHADALAMRSLYAEGDVVCCEVQAVHGDGSVHLHARSNRYGRLANGAAVTVNAHLVRRLPRHFLALPADVGVELAVGNNGVVWVQRALKAEWIAAEASETGGGSGEADALLSAEAWRRVRALHEAEPLDAAAARRVCRVRNAVAVLGAAGCVVNEQSILAVYRRSAALALAPAAMLARENVVALAAPLAGDDAAGEARGEKRRRDAAAAGDEDVQLAE